MEFVTLRRAGGSLTLTIPRTLVRSLGLKEGARVEISTDGSKLIAAPVQELTPSYTLDELLAQCDPAAPLSDEDKTWLEERPRGNELI